jgi:hypothetical protein
VFPVVGVLLSCPDGDLALRVVELLVAPVLVPSTLDGEDLWTRAQITPSYLKSSWLAIRDLSDI